MYKHILVPLDGSATAARGLEEAIALATVLGARLLLLFLMDDYPAALERTSGGSYVAGLRQRLLGGESLLATAHARATEAGVLAQTQLRELRTETVWSAIVEEASNAACDLIVMGTHGRRALNRFALGSDAEQVLRHSPVPVLLVRPAPSAPA